jgi:hypothetical protein
MLCLAIFATFEMGEVGVAGYSLPKQGLGRRIARNFSKFSAIQGALQSGQRSVGGYLWCYNI